LNSYQNLILLKNLYRLKALGFDYIDQFAINKQNNFDTPKTFEELSKHISSCHLCDLSKSRKQVMVGCGAKDAKVMILDFAVSFGDDDKNLFYTGRSGETLKNMVGKVLELSIDDVYLTHLVKCKTLNSNTPSISECKSCSSYIFAQIEFIKPKVIIVLGADAYECFSSEKDEFENVRGHLMDFKDYKLIPIYHTNHILRNPELKKETFKDLKMIKKFIDN